MKKQTLNLALTLCLGLGFGFTAGPGLASGLDASQSVSQSAAPTTVSQQLTPARLVALEAALASYHRIDASFSDSLRLARSGAYGLAFLPAPLEMAATAAETRDADDADPAIVPAPVLDNAPDLDDTDYLSEQEADSAQPFVNGPEVPLSDAADPNLNWSPEELARLRSELGLPEPEAAGSPDFDDADFDDADIDDADVAAGSLLNGRDYRYDPDLGTDELLAGNDLEKEVALQSSEDAIERALDEVDADDADRLELSDSAAMMDDLDDDDGFMLAFSRGESPLVNRLLGHGSLSLEPDGSSTVELQRLAQNIRWRISADQGARTLAELDTRQALAEPEPGLQPVEAAQLTRLGTLGERTQAGMLEPIQTKRAALINAFGTRIQAAEAERDVILASQSAGSQGPELDMLLLAKGPGFGQQAIRVQDPLSDGGQRILTSAKTQLTSGGSLEILEDRFVNARGEGMGTGVFELRDRKGAVSQGELRTIQSANGSLYSRLMLGEQVLMMHEDAQGSIRVSLPGTKSWSPLESDLIESDLRHLAD